MVTLRETFTPNRIISKMGAISFPTDIFEEEQRTPHFEMDRSLTLFETRPHINAAMKQIGLFICAEPIRAKSSDKRTHEFLNTWLDQRKEIDFEVKNMAITGLLTGNIFVERSWKEMTNRNWVLDNVFNINDSSRVYYNITVQTREDKDSKDKEQEYWLFEVPMEVRTFWFGGDGITSNSYNINYVYGSTLFKSIIWALPVHKSKIAHKKFGWSRDGIYGRSFLASAIDDGEVMNEILRNYAIMAKYRAIGRKLISIGTADDQASLEDIEKLRADFDTLPKTDHLIINKEIKAVPFAFTGDNDDMSQPLDFLRKDSGAGMTPNYLTPWSQEVNRATAQEARLPFELETNGFRESFIGFLNSLIIDELRKVYTWIAQDATFELGFVDFEPRQDKVTYGVMLFQNNAITLNEFRVLVGYEAVDGGDQFLTDLVPTEARIGGDPKFGPLGERFQERIKKPEDKKWARSVGMGIPRDPEKSQVVRSANVNGKVIRYAKSPDRFLIFDGKTLLKDFELDEKDAASAYFQVIVDKRKKALEVFYDGELPDQKVIDVFFDEVKRLNAEIIKDVFQDIKTSKTKDNPLVEKIMLGPDMIPKLDGAFMKFNLRIDTIIKSTIDKLLGVNVDEFTKLGLDVKADDMTKREMEAQATIIRQRMENQLRTMNDKMKNDVFRIISDGIATNRPVGDIQQEIKDKYNFYKSKKNPQDWQISRIARTELSNASALMKLLKWKRMGFEKVEHITVIDDVTGDKDRRFNHRIFEIDYLLSNEQDRIPIHPNCRCTYVAYE